MGLKGGGFAGFDTLVLFSALPELLPLLPLLLKVWLAAEHSLRLLPNGSLLRHCVRVGRAAC